MISFMGCEYDARGLRPQDVEYGAVVRYAGGTCTRRVLCFDGDEVILRGMRSPDVFEATTLEELVGGWNLLVPVA